MSMFDYSPTDAVVLCRLLLVTSAIGSICGKPLGHEGLCGDPIASTPKHPERCGLLVRGTAGLYCGKLAGHRSPCDPVKHDWYPVECEHGFDACPKCGDGPVPPDSTQERDTGKDQAERTAPEPPMVNMAIVERDDRLMVLMPEGVTAKDMSAFRNNMLLNGWPADRVLVVSGALGFAVLRGAGGLTAADVAGDPYPDGPYDTFYGDSIQR